MALSSACSDDDGSSSSTNSPSASVGIGTVDSASVSLGKILVGPGGRTLYMFEADTSGVSTCTGDCAAVWPPLPAVGQTTTGGDAKSELLGTTTRPDGAQQVTYNGHPLYLYQGDQQPGDTRGQGLDQFGAKWYVLNVDGNTITKTATPSGDGGY
ncbi:MAG TPA: hypothetical protein VLH10_25930 [Yinghuangia sp.]|nr:hypothetical protein [Yinghuangia sp.]